MRVLASYLKTSHRGKLLQMKNVAFEVVELQNKSMEAGSGKCSIRSL